MRTLILFSSLFLTLTSAAHAQYGGPVQFYLDVGFGFPRQPDTFTDLWNDGFGIGIAAGHAANPYLSIVAGLEWTRFGLNEEAFLAFQGIDSSGVSLDGGAFQIVTGMLSFKLDPFVEKRWLVPYLIGGFGVFVTTINDLRVTGLGDRTLITPLEAETSFGLSGGAGLELRLSPWQALFVEGKYSLGFTSGDNVQYLLVRAGVFLN